MHARARCQAFPSSHCRIGVFLPIARTDAARPAPRCHALHALRQFGPPIDARSFRIAAAERRAFRLQRLGHFENALQVLEKLIDDRELAGDSQRRAWLSALAARIAYQMEDEPRGQKLQTNAFAANNNHTPPKTRPGYVPFNKPGAQSAAIVSRLLEYQHQSALLADFDEAVAELLPETSATRYEEALANLGSHMGYVAERPDKAHGVGPDVLWRTDGAFDFVIEAKNEKEEDNPLYKKDHAQLLEAEHWFKKAYPGREPSGFVLCLKL
jgi:replicative superfamily II helicase